MAKERKLKFGEAFLGEAATFGKLRQVGNNDDYLADQSGKMLVVPKFELQEFIYHFKKDFLR